MKTPLFYWPAGVYLLALLLSNNFNANEGIWFFIILIPISLVVGLLASRKLKK